MNNDHIFVQINQFSDSKEVSVKRSTVRKLFATCDGQKDKVKTIEPQLSGFRDFESLV